MLAQIIGQFPYLGIFLLIILGGLGFPFPEDTTLILSGFLVAHQVIRPLNAFFVVYPSLLLTDFFLYAMGRKFGRKIVTHPRFHKIISPKRMEKLEARFKKHGIWVVFFGRHIFGLRAQIFLVTGVVKTPAIKFIVADAITVLFTIALMAGAGYLGGNSLQILEKDIKQIGHFAIITLLIMIIVYIVYRNLPKNNPILEDEKQTEAR